jgi:hypothetical protein
VSRETVVAVRDQTRSTVVAVVVDGTQPAVVAKVDRKVFIVSNAAVGPRGIGGGVNSINGLQGDLSLSYLDFGADPAGAAADAVTALKAESDPLTQYQRESERGAAGGYAPLGSDSLVPSIYLPSISLGHVFSVASQAAMLALAASERDLCIRTDLSKTFVLGGTADPTVLSDWLELPVAIPPQVPESETFVLQGTVFEGSVSPRWYAPSDRTIDHYIVSLDTAASTDPVVVDMLVSGSPSFTSSVDAPTLNAGDHVVVSDTPDLTSLVAATDYLQASVVSCGTDDTPGSDLTIQVIFV